MVPLPDVVHVVVAFVAEPFSGMLATSAQKVWLGPAFTVTIGVNVTTIVSLWVVQGVVPVAASISFTVPAEISAADAVYIALSDVFELNVPVPLLVQLPPVALVTLPFN